MKKINKAAFLNKKTISVCLILVLILALVFVITISLFNDAVIETKTETNTINNDSYYFIEHKFAKGSDLMLQVMVDKDDIGDDLTKLNIIIQQENSANYAVDNINSVIISESETEFINNFVTSKDGGYSRPKTTITNDHKEQYLYADNYVYYTAIIKNDELETGLVLDINYDIKGNGLYFNNSFNGYKQSIAI